MSLASEVETTAPGRRIATLFDEHAGMVLAVCRMHLRDPHDAEDAAQQSFLSAYRSLLGGTRPRNPAAWLATIARNECRKRISQRLSGPATVPLLDDATEGPTDLHAESERRAEVDALRSALVELPERQREAVVLRDLYGLSYDEVAAVMSISSPAVESLLSRGRRALEKRVAPVRALPGMLTIPASLREELARLIPGFAGSEAAAVTAGGSAAGLVAKLASLPLAGKAAATAAVATLAVGGNLAADRLGDADGSTQSGPRVAAVAKQPVVSPLTPPRDFARPAAAIEDESSGGGNSGSGSDDDSSGRSGSDSGSDSDDSGLGSDHSGSGSDDSGSGSDDSGSGSDDSGSASDDSGSRSPDSGSDSTSSGSGSLDSGSGSTSSGPDDSSVRSNNSGPGSSSSDSGSGEASSGSDESGFGSSTSGSGTVDSGSGSSEPGSDEDDD